MDKEEIALELTKLIVSESAPRSGAGVEDMASAFAMIFKQVLKELENS